MRWRKIRTSATRNYSTCWPRICAGAPAIRTSSRRCARRATRCGGPANVGELRFANPPYRFSAASAAFATSDVLLDLGAARGDRADHLALDLDWKSARDIGEVAHAHRHGECVFFRRVAGRQALRGGGNRLALHGDDREMPRPIHHQECDQPAALIDHGERNLAAKRLVASIIFRLALCVSPWVLTKSVIGIPRSRPLRPNSMTQKRSHRRQYFHERHSRG